MIIPNWVRSTWMNRILKSFLSSFILFYFSFFNAYLASSLDSFLFVAIFSFPESTHFPFVIKTKSWIVCCCLFVYCFLLYFFILFIRYINFQRLSKPLIHNEHHSHRFLFVAKLKCKKKRRETSFHFHYGCHSWWIIAWHSSSSSSLYCFVLHLTAFILKYHWYLFTEQY